MRAGRDRAAHGLVDVPGKHVERVAVRRPRRAAHAPPQGNMSTNAINSACVALLAHCAFVLSPASVHAYALMHVRSGLLSV